jgi:hypothetical protein
MQVLASLAEAASNGSPDVMNPARDSSSSSHELRVNMRTLILTLIEIASAMGDLHRMGIVHCGELADEGRDGLIRETVRLVGWCPADPLCMIAGGWYCPAALSVFVILAALALRYCTSTDCFLLLLLLLLSLVGHDVFYGTTDLKPANVL